MKVVELEPDLHTRAPSMRERGLEVRAGELFSIKHTMAMGVGVGALAHLAELVGCCDQRPKDGLAMVAAEVLGLLV